MKTNRILSALIVIVIITGTFGFTFSTEASASDAWSIAYNWNNSTKFSVDYSATYGEGYSICLDNTDYNDAYVEKTFAIEKNTHYRMSAMVKYSGYEPGEGNSGASIGKSYSYDHSRFTKSEEWTKLEYEFDSGDKTEITLCLRNGMYGATCKGTAWFSDVKLEKREDTGSTNEWNFLVLIFKNVDAPVTMNGKNYNYKDSLDDIDVKYLTGVLNNLYTSFESISGGLMKVKKIDIIAIDEKVTSLSKDGMGGYYIEPYNDIGETLDKYISKDEYNQIIAISPISGLAIAWAGVGGMYYGDIGFCEITYKTRSDYPGNFKSFPDALFVHETLHCIERKSKEINPEKTPELHNNAEFGYTDGSDEWRSWYTAYMRATLKGDKGIDPRAYMVYNNSKYSIVSDDMNAGSGFLTIKATEKPISKLSISVANVEYNGSNTSKPEVIIKDGSKTLKNGTDYSLSYANDEKVGVAKVEIAGKGNYTGSISKSYYVEPKKTEFSSITNSGLTVTLKWNKISDVDGYIIRCKKSADTAYETLETITNINLNSYKVKLKSAGDYDFKINSFVKIDGEILESADSETVSKYISYILTTTKKNRAKGW